MDHLLMLARERTVRICIMESCGRKHYAKDLCSLHYQRMKNGVNLILRPIIRNGKQGCVMNECNKPHYAFGYCSNHYMIANYMEKKIQLVIHFGEICVDCREKFSPYVFDFDCVVEDTSNHVAVGELLRSFATWERLAEEISICEMVCSNCHRTRTYGRYGDL